MFYRCRHRRFVRFSIEKSAQLPTEFGSSHAWIQTTLLLCDATNIVESVPRNLLDSDTFPILQNLPER